MGNALSGRQSCGRETRRWCGLEPGAEASVGDVEQAQSALGLDLERTPGALW